MLTECAEKALSCTVLFTTAREHGHDFRNACWSAVLTDDTWRPWTWPVITTPVSRGNVNRHWWTRSMDTGVQHDTHVDRLLTWPMNTGCVYGPFLSSLCQPYPCACACVSVILSHIRQNIFSSCCTLRKTNLPSFIFVLFLEFYCLVFSS